MRSFAEIISEFWRRILNTLNWRLVRGIGQLQILTRASYALLVIVPLLAGLWPAVKIIVNQNSQAVSEAARLLRTAHADLERSVEKTKKQIDELDQGQTGAADDQAKNRVSKLMIDLESQFRDISNLGHRYSGDYSDRSITATYLPWSFGAAFFAALFVVFGHLVYQLAAPEPVRYFTWDDFVSSRKEDYAKHGTSDALDRAREYLATRHGKRLAESERYEAEEVLRRNFGANNAERRQALRDLTPEQLRSLVSWISSGGSGGPKDYQDEMLRLARETLPDHEGPSSAVPASDDGIQNLTIIERGARAEYLRLAGQKPIGIFLSAFLYGLGAWLIFLVIKVQAAAVINAAGWRSVFDLLYH